MQLINKSDLLAPGVCVLCEGSPADGHLIVDTLKNLVTGFPFQLEGRKYVCEGCGTAVAAVLGLTSNAKQSEAERLRDIAEARLTAISGYLTGIADEIRSGKIDEIVAVAPLPAEQHQSGLAAAIESGTDPGAVSIAGPAAPAEVDAQPVTAAEADATRLDGTDVKETFDPSLTNAPAPIKDRTPVPVSAIADAKGVQPEITSTVDRTPETPAEPAPADAPVADAAPAEEAING